MGDVDDAVRGLGGVVERAHLLRFVTRRDLDRALEVGRLVELRRGRYTTPDLVDAVTAARALDGVLGLTSAAVHRGWSVAQTPPRPHVVVPRDRHVDPARHVGVELHRWDAETDGPTTSAERTVLDCATHLPLLEAVCVGDSAVRSGDCTQESLRHAAEASARTGRARRIAVVDLLDPRSENAFESAVRVIGARVPGLVLEPQVWLPGYGRPDLRDPARRLVVECDSFTYHSSRFALLRDTERYNAAAVLGHALLRFAWEHPFTQPAYVEQTLTTWVQAQDEERRAARRCSGCPRR